MIESEEMKKKEEEEKNDIKQPNSQWKSTESANDILRKFRNYEI